MGYGPLSGWNARMPVRSAPKVGVVVVHAEGAVYLAVALAVAVRRGSHILFS